MNFAGRDQKTRFALLGMLTIQPMSGYDIRKTIEASIAHFWSESYGQIYPMLKDMAHEGLVRCRADRKAPRNRQVYAITSAGREVLRGWLGEKPSRQPVRNELLLKLFFGRNTPAEVSRKQLEGYRREQAEENRRFRALERDLRREHAGHPDLPYWLATLRFGISQSEAATRWAGEACKELNRPLSPRGRKARVA